MPVYTPVIQITLYLYDMCLSLQYIKKKTVYSSEIHDRL